MLTPHLNQKLSKLIPHGEDFAIAYSGGGDSTALVHVLKDHPHAKKVYIVDHALRQGSDREARAAEDFALTCGYDVKRLKWDNKSPDTALQEKARCARYGLMGGACRGDGIKHLLTAHSEDDQAETLLMRYERNTDWRGAAGMAELTYAPLWPQLALVNIVRPLLGVTRQALREYNRGHKLAWTEDPSNQNRDFARIRARDHLETRPDLRSALLQTAQDLRAGLTEEKAILREQFSRIGKIDENGIITFSAKSLPELLFHCLRCASGQDGMIDRAKIRYVLAQMDQASFRSMTLGGALIAKHREGFVICRDPVAVKGRQDSHHARQQMRRSIKFRLRDRPQFWDGRFLVTGPKHRSYMGSVYHDASLLTVEQKQALKNIPAPARSTLPVSKQENSVRILGHGGAGGRLTESLVKMRLEAALGGVL